jgi:dihydroxyacetone kinase-like predicted kinase
VSNAPDPLANLSPAAQRLERATRRAQAKRQTKANNAAAPIATARALIGLLDTQRLALVETKRIVAGLAELNAHFGDLVNELQARGSDTPEVGE